MAKPGDIAREGVVLQAVVAHDDVHLRMGFEKRARGRGAIRRDVHGHARAPRDEHGLVAEMLRRGDVGIDAHHAERIVLAARNPSISPRDHAGIA